MSDAACTMLPEKIRANLAKFNQHTNLTCLECGYVGLVGVVRKKREFKLVWFIPFLLLILYTIFVISLALLNPFSPSLNIPNIWFYSISGAVAGIFGTETKTVYSCPNCESELQ